MDAVDDTSKLLAGTPNQAYDDSPSLLTVVIDCHSTGWAAIPDLDLRDTLSSLLIFLNAHLAMRNANKVAVIGYNGAGTKFLYPSDPLSKESAEFHLNGKMYAPFKAVGETVYNGVLAQIKATNERTVPISGALSHALCYTNRILTENKGLKGRICIVSVTEDIAAHYIATMNCIFAAQKLGTPIDVCDLNGAKSFLQQAADFTGGIYIKIDSAGLVQYLLGALSIDTSLREYVNLPTMTQVNFSAVCFGSNKVIDVGYVCSICLCTMDRVYSECPLCGTATEAGTSGASGATGASASASAASASAN